jgi:hypothetical protein
MLRGVWLEAGVDYTETSSGFTFTGWTATGTEKVGIYNLQPVSIANVLTSASPQITAGVLTFADGSTQASSFNKGGNVTGVISMDGTAQGSIPFFQYRLNGVPQWAAFVDSNKVYCIGRYNSSGVYVDSPVAVNWTTGAVAFKDVTATTVTTSGAINAATVSTTGGIAAGAAGISTSGTVKSGPGPGGPTSYVTPTAIFATKTGNTGTNDQFTEMWHDGTTGGLWINGGSSALSKGLLTATASQISSGVPQIFGKNVPVLHACWAGSTAQPNSPQIAIGCSAAWLTTGTLRIYLTTAFGWATHSIHVSGPRVSNGTNYLFPVMAGNAGDGSYIDITLQISGNGAGTSQEGQIQLTVFKVL